MLVDKLLTNGYATNRKGNPGHPGLPSLNIFPS
jgi:hypothetical protein